MGLSTTGKNGRIVDLVSRGLVRAYLELWTLKLETSGRLQPNFKDLA